MRPPRKRRARNDQVTATEGDSAVIKDKDDLSTGVLSDDHNQPIKKPSRTKKKRSNQVTGGEGEPEEVIKDKDDSLSTAVLAVDNNPQIKQPPRKKQSQSKTGTAGGDGNPVSKPDSTTDGLQSSTHSKQLQNTTVTGEVEDLENENKHLQTSASGFSTTSIAAVSAAEENQLIKQPPQKKQSHSKTAKARGDGKPVSQPDSSTNVLQPSTDKQVQNTPVGEDGGAQKRSVHFKHYKYERIVHRSTDV